MPEDTSFLRRSPLNGGNKIEKERRKLDALSLTDAIPPWKDDSLCSAPGPTGADVRDSEKGGHSLAVGPLPAAWGPKEDAF